MKNQIALLCVTSFFSGPALAGGLSDPIIPVAPPPPAIPLDWYVGVQAGLGSGDVLPEFPDTAFPDTAFDGPFYGVHAGVQRDFGALTAGVEVDVNASNLEIDDSGTGAEIDIETLAHLKLRAGTTVGSTFIYGTAGLAYASLTVEPLGAPLDLTDTAPVFGLGADMMVTESISVGGEYLVHNFEDMDDSGTDVEFSTAMLRLSYHF